MDPLHNAHHARLRMREQAIADAEERASGLATDVAELRARLAEAEAAYAAGPDILTRALHDIDASFGREVARLLEATSIASAIVGDLPETAARAEVVVADPATDAAPDEDDTAPASERRPRGWKATLHSLGWSDADRDTLPAAAVRVICRDRLRKGERSVADIAAK